MCSTFSRTLCTLNSRRCIYTIYTYMPQLCRRGAIGQRTCNPSLFKILTFTICDIKFNNSRSGTISWCPLLQYIQFVRAKKLVLGAEFFFPARIRRRTFQILSANCIHGGMIIRVNIKFYIFFVCARRAVNAHRSTKFKLVLYGWIAGDTTVYWSVVARFSV